MKKVTCLCPTYGRYELLRKSISFFLLQTYENKELIILNNHPTPIHLHPSLKGKGITVRNFGDNSDMALIHNTVLEDIEADSFVAIWEDDDVYLPWHLENVLRIPDDKDAIKPSRTIFVDDFKGGMRVTAQDNYFEGSHIVRTNVLKKYGFGPHDNPNDPSYNTGFWHWSWLDKVERYRPEFAESGYVHMWHRTFVDGLPVYHSSGHSPERLRALSCDTGHKAPITATNITPIFNSLEALREGFDGNTEEDIDKFLNKLYLSQDDTLYKR